MTEKSKIPCLFVVAAVVVCLIAFMYCSGESSINFFSMDTYCSAKVTGIGNKKATEEIEKISDDLDKSCFSRFDKNSEIFMLNNSGGGKISDRLACVFETLSDISRKSDGAFDFTLGALSDLWNFKGNPSLPEPDEIKSILAVSGTDKLSFGENEIMVPEGIILDLGAIGKGSALDSIYSFIDSRKGIKSAVVSLGGSILLYGKKAFSVGIRHPEKENDMVAVLDIPAGFVSTSGSYERFFEFDGKRYHHILDPETGYPADSGVVSVTIIAGSGIVSDALSTACFVLGTEAGMKLAREYGCEAVFIESDGDIVCSDGIKDCLTITDDEYSLK